MINKRKIVIMTKLAVYDKNHGEKDRKVNEYYQHDFVYRRNSLTRFYACIGSIILLIFYWIYQFAAKGVDVFTLDYHKALMDMAFFIIAVAIFYTFIGSGLAISEYRKAQKRFKKYLVMMQHLERIKHETDLEEASDDEADFINTREHN